MGGSVCRPPIQTVVHILADKYVIHNSLLLADEYIIHGLLLAVFRLGHITRQVDDQPQDKDKIDAQNAEDLEKCPGFGREVVCHIEIHQTEQGKKYDQAVIGPCPDNLRCFEHVAHEPGADIFSTYELTAEADSREDPENESWFPFDKTLIVQQQCG